MIHDRASQGDFVTCWRARAELDPVAVECRLAVERNDRKRAARRGGRYGRRTLPGLGAGLVVAASERRAHLVRRLRRVLGRLR